MIKSDLSIKVLSYLSWCWMCCPRKIGQDIQKNCLYADILALVTGSLEGLKERLGAWGRTLESKRS